MGSKIITLIFLAFFAVLLMGAKPLYEIVDISALNETHHERRITVFGTITAIEYIKGRHGSENSILSMKEGESTVMVSVPFFVIRNMQGSNVFVQGKYISHCFVGGIRVLDACLRMEHIGRR